MGQPTRHENVLPRPRRIKMDIYNDVMSAVKQELTGGEVVMR
jgi:hypothetical protein